MSRRARHRFLVAAAVATALSLLATACSGSTTSSRSASGAKGNPVDLPALSAGTASGERVPTWTRAEVTPNSWVSTSLVPTLAVPGGTGPWTFKLSDLSDGTSSFGTRTYSENGASTRVPSGLLVDGSMYTWTAESPGRPTVGGSFTVDVQMREAQVADSVGGVEVALSSGEASYSWSSHAMQSLGGAVGVSLRFQASNAAEPGVPAGWMLSTSSGSPYLSVVTRGDNSVGLVSQNGQVSSYRKGSGDAWNPVKLAGDGLDTSGVAPVLISNSDGSFSVTTKASTARFVDDNSDGTANLAGVSADGGPMLQQQWSGGLLRKITDPVSGRSVELSYGGSTCPKVASGFVAAPKDMLCQVKFWDGSTSSISYVALADGSVSIGRFVDYPEAGVGGAQVSDLAYDASGRISRTRSPLVAVAGASGIIAPDDSQYMVDVAYSPTGRVSSITDAAPTAGGVRCTRTYDNEGTLSLVVDSCLGREVERVLFDGTTFFPLVVTDVMGRELRNTWDLTTGNLLSSVDITDRVTTNTYENGNIVLTRGPSRILDTAQSVLRSYDESYAQSAEGVAMRGLDVVYWPSANDRGADAVSELGPLENGALTSSLTVNWSKSPAGNTSGGWSGLMSGTLSIAKGGTYKFESGTDTANLRIANTACELGGCDALELPIGPVSIRVEIVAPSPEASIDLTWSGPDTGGVSQSIPTARLQPQYGYATETNVVDPTAVRSNAENISRTTYANPAEGLVTGRTNGAGSLSTIAYERSGWNRPTQSALPAGNVLTQSWWGDKESAKAPCPNAKSAVQGGASKQTITPGADGGVGPSTQQWYTASGSLAANQIEGGATQCLTYDSAGRPSGGEILGLGDVAKISVDFAVGGNPLITSVTETKGSAVTTTTVEVDLAGRPIRSVDQFGIVTLTTYDTRTGAVAAVTSTPPGGLAVVTESAYDEFGRPTTTSIDGKVVATIGYGAYGLPVSATYANGAVTTYTSDDQDRPIAARTVVGGRTYESSRVVSGAGAMSSSTLTAEGKSSTFDYTHDTNGRLSSVAVSAGLSTDARTWAYTYDANSNRLSQSTTVNGAAKDSFTYSYDKADRLVTTNDPLASGITYDDRGNALTVGADTFTYDASNLLLSVTDGNTTVAFERSVTGGIIGKTTTTATGATTIRYGADGFILDDQGRPTARLTTLPGGVQLTRTIGGSSTWTFLALSGDRFFALDDTGAQVGSVSAFDPFGVQVAGPSTVNGSLPDLTWRAAETNETSALATPIVTMGQRVYVPALGRFLNLDPVVGGSANGYDYANQDPTSFSDPSGNADRSSMDWLGVALVAVAAIGASLLVPASAGPGTSMVVSTLIGVAAGVTNLMVQALTGGDMAIGIASVGVGILAGVASGGIVGKIKAVRFAKTQPPKEGLVDWVIRNESQVRYRSDLPAGSAAPKSTVRQSVRVPQPSTGVKAPQAIPENVVSQPIGPKAPLRIGDAGYGESLAARAKAQTRAMLRPQSDDGFADFMMNAKMMSKLGFKNFD